MRLGGLRLFGRLDRYVGGLFLSSYATAFMLVVGLFLILEMSQTLDDLLERWPDGRRASSLLIARYYLLNVPFVFLQVAPFVTLVAGMFTISKLVKHNETVAVLTAGVGAWRMLAPVLVLAAACGTGMFALRELVSARLAERRDAVAYVLENKTLDLVYANYFIRDPLGGAVRLGEFRPATPLPPEAGPAADPRVPEIRGLLAIRGTAREHSKTTASRARWLPRGEGMGWRLEGGVRQDPGMGAGGLAVEWLDGFEFTPELATTYRRARENPLDLSFREVRELAGRDPDNSAYQTLAQYHLTFPLANLVLLLIGLPILMRHDRRRGAEGLAAGSLLCLFYFAADFVFRQMGLQGGLDPVLAAWIPVLFFGSLGLVLMDSMRS